MLLKGFDQYWLAKPKPHWYTFKTSTTGKFLNVRSTLTYFASNSNEARHESKSSLKVGERLPKVLHSWWQSPVGSLCPFPGTIWGGVTVKFSASAAHPGHHVKSWFNISVRAESEQVQELGNHFVPTFEYFSSSASWLRCASSFPLPLISPARDRFAAQDNPNRLLNHCHLMYSRQRVESCPFHSYEATSFCCGITSPLRTYGLGPWTHVWRRSLKGGSRVFGLRNISPRFSSPRGWSRETAPAPFREWGGKIRSWLRFTENLAAKRENWSISCFLSGHYQIWTYLLRLMVIVI